MSPTRDWAVWPRGGKRGWRGWKNGTDSDKNFRPMSTEMTNWGIRCLRTRPKKPCPSFRSPLARRQESYFSSRKLEKSDWRKGQTSQLYQVVFLTNISLSIDLVPQMKSWNTFSIPDYYSLCSMKHKHNACNLYFWWIFVMNMCILDESKVWNKSS